MQVLFSPQKPGQQSVDYLDVIALGATNCSVIKCIGIGKGEVLIIIITIIINLFGFIFPCTFSYFTYLLVSKSVRLLIVVDKIASFNIRTHGQGVVDSCSNLSQFFFLQ